MCDLNEKTLQENQLLPKELAQQANPPCLACKVAMNTGAKFCPECGSKVSRENVVENAQADIYSAHSSAAFHEKPASETQPEAPVPKSTTSPEVEDSVPAQSATPKSLPQCNCGQYLPPDARFCNRCGTEVGQAQQHRLVCKGMSGAAEIVDLSQRELIIGKSSDCTLVISNDDYVSRHHARLIQADGQVVLEDLNSANGTFLRVRNPVPLSPGDEFLIGTCLIRFE